MFCKLRVHYSSCFSPIRRLISPFMVLKGDLLRTLVKIMLPHRKRSRVVAFGTRICYRKLHEIKNLWRLLELGPDTLKNFNTVAGSSHPVPGIPSHARKFFNIISLREWSSGKRNLIFVLRWVHSTARTTSAARTYVCPLTSDRSLINH